jgi:hypothetical protein
MLTAKWARYSGKQFWFRVIICVRYDRLVRLPPECRNGRMVFFNKAHSKKCLLFQPWFVYYFRSTVVMPVCGKICTRGAPWSRANGSFWPLHFAYSSLAAESSAAA